MILKFHQEYNNEIMKKNLFNRAPKYMCQNLLELQRETKGWSYGSRGRMPAKKLWAPSSNPSNVNK
jgi:hypothetical protein